MVASATLCPGFSWARVDLPYSVRYDAIVVMALGEKQC